MNPAVNVTERLSRSDRLLNKWKKLRWNVNAHGLSFHDLARRVFYPRNPHTAVPHFPFPLSPFNLPLALHTHQKLRIRLGL